MKIDQDKFAELKKAHKNGAIIECLQTDGTWFEVETPQWQTECEYRIKPISKEEHKELIIELSNSESYDDPYNWGSIIIDTDNYRNNTLEANSKEYSMKTDIIVQNVVKKYQERSEVGIKKYNTTLQENSDGVEVFLNHLQEELMDATLYIEKLKQQVKQLKDII